MYEIEIKSSIRSYSLQIGQDLLKSILIPRPLIIMDSNISDPISISDARQIRIEADETNKSLETCEGILKRMRELDCNRSTTVMAMGGGFVQDISTLVSALYMRGLDWIFIPTTLMAMMDSCIGGKSSINVGVSKNLIGNFYPPSRVIIDVNFCRSLNKSAIASGLAEGIKICFARGEDSYATFLKLYSAIDTFDSEAGTELVSHVLESKKWFVEQDEFDGGVRQLLNFGHTFGHALESATKFAVPHGIAICFGMLAAIHHPMSKIGSQEMTLERECLAIFSPIVEEYRSALKELDWKIFSEAFAGDKKHTDEHLKMILPSDGKLKVVSISRGTKATKDIVEAAEFACSAIFTL